MSVDSNKNTIPQNLLVKISSIHNIKNISFHYHEPFSSFYRGIDSKGADIEIKVLHRSALSRRLGDNLNFRSELSIIGGLTLAGVKESIFNEFDGYYYFISKEIEERNLDNYLSENTPAIDILLDLFIKICRSVENLHLNGIVHRGITLDNILLYKNDNSYGVKITDYSVSYIKDYHSLTQNKEDALKQFAFMSPEQIKLGKGVDISIDERCDIYALGVVLYRMLTGSFPFTDDEPARLLQKQISDPVLSPDKLNRELTDELSKIVIKLLEKDAENRYQSVDGLVKDIEKILNEEKNFELGLEDKFVKLEYRTRLIGRDHEIGELTRYYNNTLDGTGSIVNISGVAGAGKTRLATELADKIKIDEKNLLAGKFFTGANKEPYGPFKEAIERYIEIFENYDDAKKESIRNTLLGKIGSSGRILLDFNEKIEVLIGDDHPAIEKLDSKDKEDSRYRSFVGNFIFYLAEAEKTLVLMLDDWQWCDEASLKLLEDMIYSIANSYLLIINTYRKEEVDAEHSFYKFITYSVSEELPLSEIRLELFDKKRLTSFVAALLRVDESVNPVGELAGYILSYSEGNPFFSLEVLRRLIDEEYLLFDQSQRDWKINGALHDIDMPKDIIGAVLKRLEKLGAGELEILSIAAMIGRKFDIELIFELLADGKHYTKESIVRIINNALKIQLLNMDREDKEGRRYLFVHDRIKEACLERIPEKTQIAYHKTIAATLEKNHAKESGYLFDIAHHYIEAKDDDKIVEWAYKAGCSAKENYANEQAIGYFEKVLGIVERWIDKNERKAEWTDKKKTILQSISEIYLTIGENDKAIEILEQKLLPLEADNFEKSIVYRSICTAYYKKGDWGNTEKYGAIGLKLLGEKLPTKKIWIIISLIKELIVNLFVSRFYKGKKHTKNLDYHKNLAWFYYPLSWHYTYCDTLKFIRTILRLSNYCYLNIGKSEELAMAIGASAGVFMVLGLFQKSEILQIDSMEMHNKLNTRWGIAQIHQFIGYNMEWAGNYSKAEKAYRKSIEIFDELGDSNELGKSFAALAHILILKSANAEGTYYNEKYEAISKKAKDMYGIKAVDVGNLVISTELGDFESAEKYGIDALQFLKSQKELNEYTYCTSNTEMAMLYLEKGELEKAQEHIDIAWELYAKNSFLKHYSVNIFNYLAEINYAFITQKEQLSKNWLGLLKKQTLRALKETKRWAAHYGGALRIRAKYLALVGKNSKADKYFRASIVHTAKIGRRYEEAKSRYEYGLFLKKLSEQDRISVKKSKEYRKDAITELEKSYTICKEIGAKQYFKRCTEALGGRVEREASNAGEDMHTAMKFKDILKIQSSIQEASTVEEVIEEFAQTFIKSTFSERVAIFLTDSTSDKLRFVKGIGFTGAKDIPSQIIDTVSSGQMPLISNNLRESRSFQSKYFGGFESKHFDPLPKSLMAAPVVIKDWNKTMGVIYMDSHATANLYTEKEQEDTIEPLVASIAGLYKKERISAYSNKVMNNRMVEWIVDHGNDPSKMTSVNQNNAVMFTDIRRFTDLSEKIGDPEKLTGFLNAYFEAVSMPIFELEDKNSAHIDKYIGDAMMILFDDPQIALSTAVKMRSQVHLFNTQRDKFLKNDFKFYDPVDMGVGLAFGPVTLGTMGTPHYLDFTSIGDTVNVASRIEGVTKEYHAPLIINDELYNNIDKNLFNLRLIDKIRVKGKEKPVSIYEEFSSNSPPVRDFKNAVMDRYNELQAIYFSGKDLDSGIKLADELLESAKKLVIKHNLGTDSPADFVPFIYKERMIELQNNTHLLEKWDGVFTFMKK